MSDRDDSQNVDHLLARLADDTATPEDIALLEQILASDAHARRRYVHYCDLHEELRHRARVGELEMPSVRPVVGDSARYVPEPARLASPTLGFLRHLAALSSFSSGKWSAAGLAIGVLLTVGIVTAVMTRGPHHPDVGPELARGNSDDGISRRNAAANSPRRNMNQFPAGATVARLARTVNCRWVHEARALVAGDELPAGRMLEMQTGVAEIKFDIGARVILQSPATLELLSATSARLGIGKATVEIQSDRARGFKIITPETTYVDQGTEFGVEVAPGGGSMVHVFQGVVDLDRQSADSQGPHLTHRLQANVGARMEAGEKGMTLVEDTGECFIRSMDDADRDRHTIAYWRFEDRPLGAALPHNAQNSTSVRATIDSTFNGNDLFSFERTEQPRMSGDVPCGTVPHSGIANRGCLDTTLARGSSPWQNLYTKSRLSHAAPLDIQAIAPAQWTIEVSVKPKSLHGTQTFVGRDGCDMQVRKPGRIAPRLAFQITAANRFAIRFADCENREHWASAEKLSVETGRWYNLAAASNGRTLRLFVDANNGQGYQLQGQTDLPRTGSTALSAGSGDAEWSIGRSRDRASGGPAEFFEGWIDEVRISDVALEPAEFLFAAPRGRAESEGGR